jgi:CarD family transcriptional regulator
MFKVGDHVVYGTNGVCLVTDVCPSPFDKKDTRTYYVLKPVSGPAAAVIYTPVDNERIPMRSLISVSEGESLLSRVSAIPSLPIPNEKARREAYRAAITTGDPEAYVAVIKTIGGRRADFAGTQRRIPEFEMEYDGVARRHLCTELSLVLGRTAEEIAGYLGDLLDNQQAM